MNDKEDHLQFQVRGNGKSLVLLHGFLESSSMWKGFQLDGYQLITIDLPGHGKSEFISHRHDTLQKVAEEIKGIMHKKGLTEYSVVGHSMGGYVALELMKIDANCKSLILLNSNFWKDSAEKVRDRERVAEIVKRSKNMFISEAIPNLYQNPEKHGIHINELIADAKLIKGEAIAGMSIAMSKRSDNTEYVAKNQNRILIVQGENDSVVPLKTMSEAIADMDQIQMIMLPSGHMAHVECPELLEKSILSYLIKK